METLHLDTHVLVWLKTGNKRLGNRQRRLLNRAKRCAVSPAVFLELEYLHEIGRTKLPAQALIEPLYAEINLSMDDAPFPAVARRAAELAFTRDCFDRMICAQADVAGVQLLTADTHLLEHFSAAVWD